MIIHHLPLGQTNRRDSAVMKGKMENGKIGTLQVSFIDGMRRMELGWCQVNAIIFAQTIQPRDTFRHSTPLNSARASGRR